jgi:hypothetical protein
MASKLAISLSNNEMVGPFETPAEVNEWLTKAGFKHWAGPSGHPGSKYNGKIRWRDIELDMAAIVYKCHAPTDNWLPENPPGYPWHIQFSDNTTFDLPADDRERLLAQIRSKAALGQAEVWFEVHGKVVKFCDSIYGNQDGPRIRAILQEALPDSWRCFNLAYGTRPGIIHGLCLSKDDHDLLKGEERLSCPNSPQQKPH